MAIAKRRKEIEKLVEGNKLYKLSEAVELVKKGAVAKFDETIELSAQLGVDPKQSDQQVRGTVVLPKGTGGKARVLVFAKGAKENEAKEAGADVVGAEDLVTKIQGGWLDFDVCVATPDMMREVGKLGKVLGPRGLMPNPKTGTVTMKWSGSRAVQPQVLIIRGRTELLSAAFNIASGKPVEVPAGEYEIRAAAVAAGDPDSQVFQHLTQMQRSATRLNIAAGQRHYEHHIDVSDQH